MAICDRSFLNSSSNESAFFDSGTTFISLIKLGRLKSSRSLLIVGSKSFASKIPRTSFLAGPRTGYLECPESIILLIMVTGSSSGARITISTLGTIISFTVVSPNLIARSAINCASLSINLAVRASSSNTDTSSRLDGFIVKNRFILLKKLEGGCSFSVS